MIDAERQATALDENRLAEFMLGQRWFGEKAREIAWSRVIQAVPARTEEPLLVVALVEVRFHPGTHVIYQLPLGFRRSEEGWDERVVLDVDGWTAYDALADPVLGRELVHLVWAQATLRSQQATSSSGRCAAARPSAAGSTGSGRWERSSPTPRSYSTTGSS